MKEGVFCLLFLAKLFFLKQYYWDRLNIQLLTCGVECSSVELKVVLDYTGIMGSSQ